MSGIEHRNLQTSWLPSGSEFKKILDHRSLVPSDPVGALAQLQLGRAYWRAGDRARAKTVYDDFLALWKQADRGIPILTDARRDCARILTADRATNGQALSQ